MKKHFRFLSLVALLTATALTSCQKEEWEMDSPSESESELEDDGTRAEYITSSSYLKQEVSKYIANPEKGLYKQYEYWFKNGTLPTVTPISFDEGTLVLTLFYLYDYRDQEIHGSDVTNKIQDVFNAVRNANKKAIVRFAYTNSKEGSDKRYAKGKKREACWELMEQHLNKILPTLEKNKDVIYVVQAGFIGTWGEWYYTSNPEFNWFDTNDYSGQYNLVNKLMNGLPDRQIAVRTPKYKRIYLHNYSSSYPLDYSSSNSKLKLYQPYVEEGNSNARLSMHNDVFMYDDRDEQGTFGDWIEDPQISVNRKMWEDQSAFLAVGGETASYFPTKEENGEYVLDEDMTEKMKAKDPVVMIKKYHFSYLNRHKGNSELYDYWLTLSNKERDIKNTLGYCLWLTSFKTTTESNGYTYFKFSIKNSGAAPIIYQRPISLVLLDKNNKNVKVLASSAVSKKNLFKATYQDKTKNYSRTSEVADIRRIAPDDEVFYACRISTELINSYRNKKGAVKVALWIPDQSKELQANPDYSIHLCNKETSGFTWKNGYNVIYQFK